MAVKTKTKSDRIILNKQLLKQFGKDYRPPTLEECQVAPKATLQEILKELNVPPAAQRKALLLSVKSQVAQLKKQVLQLEKQLSHL